MINQVKTERKFLPLLILVLALTIGVGITGTIADRSSVIANWSEYRCNIGPMFMGFLYKPADDKRSVFEFSSDNFQFCLKKIQKTAVNEVISGPLDVFKSQIGVANNIQNVQNSMKITTNNIINNVIGKVVSSFYQKLKIFGYSLSRTLFRLKSAFNRIEASLQAAVYLGISMMKGFLNGMNFVIMVVLIILAILIALVIILFMFFFPVIPVILITISALLSIGIEVGEAAATFCFDEDTLIETKRGTIKISELKIDDVLINNSIVSGLYKFTAEGTNMYNLYGVKVSGDHIVFDENEKRWICVSNHKDAIKIDDYKGNYVYCPTVKGGKDGNRTIVINGIKFKDWEEMNENDEDGYKMWNDMISYILNEKYVENDVPTQINAVSSDINVMVKNKGLTKISNVDIGDYILSESGWTKVLGIYKEKDIMGSNEYICDGIWIKTDGIWKHMSNKCDNMSENIGYNLITETGDFYIKIGEKNILIKDALEVGYDRIKETYNFINERIN